MKVGVHQGSVLSPLVFAVMVMMSVRNGLVSEMLYVDDLVLTSKTMEGMMEKWMEACKSKRLKVSLRKTKGVVSGAEGEMSVTYTCRSMWYLWEASNGKFS